MIKTLQEAKKEGVKNGFIYNCDCLDLLKLIPDKTIDLCLTDPPYELDWRQSINFKNRKSMFHHRKETQKWDMGVQKLYPILFKELDRLIKYNGSIIIFTRSEYITWAVESGKANNFDNKATIIWHKTNPIPQVRKKNYLSSIETILWMARYNEKKCPFTFNFKTQNEMHNFIEMPLCGGNERTKHPTQKPLKLIEHLIQIHSNENDIILDPFSGSGTTGLAAEKLDRRWILCDISEEYCKISEERIKNYKAQKRLI